MQIGVIAAYGVGDWHAARILTAAAARGRARLLSPRDFSVSVDPGGVRVRVGGAPVATFDLLLLPRALGPEGTDVDVQLGLYALAEEGGALLVNDPRALLAAEDKLRTSVLLARAAVPTPPAALVQTATAGTRALVHLGPSVVKPVFGSLGIGVARVAPGDEAPLVELVTREGAAYLQAWVETRRELRVFVVGPHVVAAAERIAAPGDFRANWHQGGLARGAEPSTEETRVAVAAARALGLAYAGVDLATGPAGVTVLEVNGAPSFQALEAATGIDIAGAIVDEGLRLAGDNWPAAAAT